MQKSFSKTMYDSHCLLRIIHALAIPLRVECLQLGIGRVSMLGSTTTAGYAGLALCRPAPFGITLRTRAIFIEYIELLYMCFFTQISCFMCMSFGCRGFPNILRSDPLGFAPPLQLSGPLANKLQESLLYKQARYMYGH